MKRTARRIVFTNWDRVYKRRIYSDASGREFFRYKGMRSYIFRATNDVYIYPCFRFVKFIED